ncbi:MULTISPECIES: spore protease YyaC [unclassified Clostridium]|uniref:Spore protease YyaC n=1 Tax=Clostridium sulfidigenes TaxID=318464 RepID=A0A927W5Z6_9CLOT|nr:spore protease YyaC [Clostridium sulfidigenes]HAR87179.1 spore protease YyaC [Clostridium sp.]
MVEKVIFDALSDNSIYDIREILSEELTKVIKDNRDIVILCIGTDRSTGDSLGPLVGYKLKFLVRDKVFIYGNLENPVHAKNISETNDLILKNHNNPYIIAIDASLGGLQNVGKVIIESKPLYPGAALNKNLPSVGDLSIVGIVNISGSLEFMVLQNTRLYIVMKLAEVISSGIYHSIIKTIGGRKSSSKVNNKYIPKVLDAD